MGEDSTNTFRGELSGVKSAEAYGNIVNIIFSDDVKGRITFLENNIFRYDVDPKGEFAEYAEPREREHKAKIQQYPDNSKNYAKPMAEVISEDGIITIKNGNAAIIFDKTTAKMQVKYHGRTVMEEYKPLFISNEETIQTPIKHAGENFYGGGTQNGRFVHTGKKINIVNESSWLDGGVASPNPFYYTTNGYGVLRNTFSDGSYDFGENDEKFVSAAHKESKFSGYFFLSKEENSRKAVQDLLKAYYHVTGNPILLPEYGFYEGHLNCYNRDSWSEENGGKLWNYKGTDHYAAKGITRYETGMSTGYRLTGGLHSESLNGERPTVAAENYPDSVDTPYEYSARAVVDKYFEYDMPLGYFLPNDGYGGGYGQNGYYKQGGVSEDGISSDERIKAVDANVANLTRFTDYISQKGVATGLWTESNLSPTSENSSYWHLLRDFRKEVSLGGVTTLKTDVAWVGPGYSFQLNGVKTAYDIVTTSENFRPNIISLDGWAGSQRFNSVWSGDQTGGNWEYIRFHIPTYIGSSLSGNPNIGSDMDGIFGGKALISTRDFQWKSFTPQMLNMDGWGSYMKSPFTFGDPYTGINRMYMKIKAQLLPYIYTTAASASNIDTGNDDTGLPIVRAMFLEYPGDSHAYSCAMKYQFMLGANMLIAPIYRNTSGDSLGNDIRNNIYLPNSDEIWIDYITGEKYRGGQTINNFNASLWKLPVFVKNGSILPMYEENNSPDFINKANRIIEFWPYGDSEYTVYEDDGKYMENKTEEDADYGIIDHISYGEHVSAKYTSSVKGDRAILTAKALRGNYRGYNQNRGTTFIVNVSEKPRAISAQNGSLPLNIKEAVTREKFNAEILSENEAIFFYDAAPKLKTYASPKEKEFISMVSNVKIAPKLYIRLGVTDTQKNSQTVVIEGFVNAAELMADRLNPSLDIPTLTAPEEGRNPARIALKWNEIKDADIYEMLVDNNLYSMGDSLEYFHDDLEYNSLHSYRIRSRNHDGYSQWSDEITVSTLLDPWRNEISSAGKIIWEGGDDAGSLKYAIDHSITGLFFSTTDVVDKKLPFVFDFGRIYELDKFEYYPRDNYGSGTVEQMNIYSSFDGKHWKLEWDGENNLDWIYNPDLELAENVKIVPLSGVSARFIKLVVIKSKKNWFASHELAVYKKDGSKSFAVGSTNKNEAVSEGDYTNMKNYLGTSVKDGSNFIDQIQKRCGDINMNGIYDVYDYAYTMFNLDGGTKQTGDISGRIKLIPSAGSVKTGEIFTITAISENVKNLNAFGKVMHYNPSQVEFISLASADCISEMENLTVNKKYADGSAYLNLAFANRGDKKLYNGSESLVTITFKALAEIDIEKAIELQGVTLIDTNFNIVEE